MHGCSPLEGDDIVVFGAIGQGQAELLIVAARNGLAPGGGRRMGPAAQVGRQIVAVHWEGVDGEEAASDGDCLVEGSDDQPAAQPRIELKASVWRRWRVARESLVLERRRTHGQRM